MRLCKTYFTLAIVFLLIGCSENQKIAALSKVEQINLLDNLVSAEYKILIDLEHLSNKNNYNTILTDIKNTAKELDFKVKTKDEPLKLEHRAIQYLDTESKELRTKGYTLRYRQHFKSFSGFESKKNQLASHSDVTLKYRNSDKAIALGTDISIGKKRFPKLATAPELEADVTTGAVIFSKSVKIKLNENKYGSFSNLSDHSIGGKKGYSTIFPSFTDLNINGGNISPVGKITIIEAKAKPCKISFPNNIKSNVSISTFHSETGQPIIGEVSFDFDIIGKKHKANLKNIQDIDSFYSALLNRLGN